MTTARRFALLAVVATLWAPVGALPSWAPDPAVATEPATPTSPAPATLRDPDPSRTFGAPSLAVDPENPLTVVAAMTELRTRRCGLARSLDGGRSWQLLAVSPSPPGFPLCTGPAGRVAQASVAFGRNGTLYYAMLGYDVGDGPNRSVLVSRSLDLGNTWKTTAVRDARSPDATGEAVERNQRLASLVVDTAGADEDSVYVGFSRLDPRGQLSIPLVSASHDGARSFSEPVDVRADMAGGAWGAVERLALDRRGRLYAVWTAVAPDDATGIALSRSDDGGRTFTTGPVVAAGPLTVDSSGTARLAWGPGGGGPGTLHVVFDGGAGVLYTRSPDGGATWSLPRPLNDDAGVGPVTTHRLPDIAVSPGGRIDVVWWDTRAAAGSTGNDVYLTSSSDGGRSWQPNVRVTDRTVDRSIGSWPNADVNGPPGLTSSSASAVVAWDDTRNGDTLTQTQDIYTSIVSDRRPAGPPSALSQVSLAGVTGVLAVGLILMAAACDANGGTLRRSRSAVGGRKPLGVG